MPLAERLKVHKDLDNNSVIQTAGIYMRWSCSTYSQHYTLKTHLLKYKS